jgi:hypothetical protein
MRPAQVAAKGRNYQQLLGFLRIFGSGEIQKREARADAEPTARQGATKDELPRKVAKITKTEEFKLLSLCSLRSLVAKILF